MKSYIFSILGVILVLSVSVFADKPPEEQWLARYNGPNGPDYSRALTIDNSGNVYVTGTSHPNGATDTRYVTIKYDPNGNQLWVKRYNGPADSYDSSRAMAIDDSGNVYVTGWGVGSGTSADYVTIKYTQHDYCISPFPGDYDGDCKVNFTDFAMLAEDWLQSTYIEDLAELAEDWLECNFALEEDCF
jgi:hypothetical protein